MPLAVGRGPPLARTLDASAFALDRRSSTFFARTLQLYWGAVYSYHYL